MDIRTAVNFAKFKFNSGNMVKSSERNLYIHIYMDPNLGERVILPSYWFSLDNSETVKVVTLAFFSI